MVVSVGWAVLYGMVLFCLAAGCAELVCWLLFVLPGWFVCGLLAVMVDCCVDGLVMLLVYCARIVCWLFDLVAHCFAFC